VVGGIRVAGCGRAVHTVLCRSASLDAQRDRAGLAAGAAQDARSRALAFFRDYDAILCPPSQALARPHADTGFENPAELFAAAERHGCLDALESLARGLAFDEAASWPASALLFLNNSPPTFMEETFAARLEREIRSSADLAPRRMVLELTEHAAFERVYDVGARTSDLRGRGFQMAIDDVGAGMNGLNQITFLRPNWIKLDRPPDPVMYFHARYHQEYPPEMGKPYTLFEGKGKGHYVGTVLSSQNAIGHSIEFTPQARLGLHYLINKKWSIDAETMFHHISNAGLDERNRGINAFGGFIGLTYFFDRLWK